MGKLNLFTRNFNGYLKLVIKLILAIGLVCFFLLRVFPQYTNSYTGVLADKVDRLMSIEEPKIVLIGNSNLAFGIDSKMLEEEFHMPVVNMGFHGACGNDFHERMMGLNICEGDIYIVCHHVYWDDSQLDHIETVWESVENNVDLWKLINASDYGDMLAGFPAYFRGAIDHYLNCDDIEEKTQKLIYSKDAINTFGDIAIHRAYEGYRYFEEVTPPKIGGVQIDRLNEWNARLREKGAQLLVAGYPIIGGEKIAATEEFRRANEELRRQLDCPVISRFEDYIFDEDLFYGHYLHLTTEGAKKRTEVLINDINGWLQENK